MFYHFAEVLPSLRRNRRENEVFGFPGSAYRIGLLCRRRVLLQKLSPPNTRPTDTAGLSAERVFPGCVDCVFLPAEGHFIFTQPGKSILAEPCILKTPSLSLTNHRHPVSTSAGATSAASYFPQQQQQAYTYSGLPTAAAAAGTMSSVLTGYYICFICFTASAGPPDIL